MEWDPKMGADSLHWSIMSGSGATLKETSQRTKRSSALHAALPRLPLNDSSLKSSSGHTEHTKAALQSIMLHGRPGWDHTCERW